MYFYTSIRVVLPVVTKQDKLEFAVLASRISETPLHNLTAKWSVIRNKKKCLENEKKVRKGRSRFLSTFCSLSMHYHG